MNPRPPFRKILIANRGEIAVRVMRTCREMGVRTVAIYSDADRTSLHVRYAGEAYRVGPPPSSESYLRIDRIVEIARRTGAEAVHPGYGFLSENPEFAQALADAGIVLIGPPANAMVAMGEKTRARKTMIAAGVPVVPGTEEAVADADAAEAAARSIGYPIMLKAAAGGGGKGMRRVDDPAGLRAAFEAARREAVASFGDPRIYLERYLDQPRHVEVQILADTHGNVIHLGERECSVQRRHQKVIEETPSPVVDEAMRARMGEVASQAARAVGYVGAGTVEFLVDASRAFYFLEMNTRLQVEHPITEMVNDGIDLVRMQLEIAAGASLEGRTSTRVPRGHAIEARIYAEDPDRGFLPTPGKIASLRVPGGPGIRLDSGVYAGWEVPIYYDPMIAKLCARAPDRATALARLDRALSELVVTGLRTNVAWLRRVIAHPTFASGDYDTGFLDAAADDLVAPPSDGLGRVALIAGALYTQDRLRRLAREALSNRAPAPSAWKMEGRRRGLR